MPLWTWIACGELGRIDRTLTDAIAHELGAWDGPQVKVSRSQIQRLIEEGCVKIGGKNAVFNSKIVAGSMIEIEFPPAHPIDLIPEDRPIEILYEDKDLLVVNKPPGLTVHPSETQRTGTLVHALLHHVKDLSGIGGELRPGIVHRIDKNTSGALVITKSDDAHRKLVEVFSKHAIDRIYWALVYGSPVPPSGKIVNRLGRNPADRKKMAVLEEGGREAITHYRCIQEFGTMTKKPFASFIEVKLETGRTHQVRVQLASIGHSLLGDPAYGTPSRSQSKWLALPRDVQDQVDELPGQALHARVLGFEHPITGQKLRFEAEPPASFKDLNSKLSPYAHQK